MALFLITPLLFGYQPNTVMEVYNVGTTFLPNKGTI